jgi:hypothetical protein
MAKANLLLPDGTKVILDGKPDEIATLLAKIGSISPPLQTGKPESSKVQQSGDKRSKSKKTVTKGPLGFISELAEEGFFKTRQTLPDIQKKLEERGHIYAQTSLSPAMVRLTRKRAVRRLKEKKGWVYVN